MGGDSAREFGGRARRLTDSSTNVRDGMLFNIDEVTSDSSSNTWRVGIGRTTSNQHDRSVLRSAGLHAMRAAVSDEGKGPMRKWVSEPSFEEARRHKQQRQQQQQQRREKGEKAKGEEKEGETENFEARNDNNLRRGLLVGSRAGGQLSRSIPDLSHNHLHSVWKVEQIVDTSSPPDVRTQFVRVGRRRMSTPAEATAAATTCGDDVITEESTRGKQDVSQSLTQIEGVEEGGGGENVAESVILYWMVLNSVAQDWEVLNRQQQGEQ